jgi:hypothetical protein
MKYLLLTHDFAVNKYQALLLSYLNRLKILAGVAGIEPAIKVLETLVIPFHHTPNSLYFGRGCRIRTCDPLLLLGTSALGRSPLHKDQVSLILRNVLTLSSKADALA